MQEINSIMDGIFAQRWTKEITEQLEKIIQNITLYEWAKAVDMIEELSGLCSHE
jgi:glucan phosphorylase